MGVILKVLGKLDEAETSCRKAIELKPDLAEAHNNLGNTLKELGRLDEAETNYRKAIDLKSSFREAECGLGNVMISKGQHKEGLEKLRLGQGAMFFDIDNGVVIQ